MMKRILMCFAVLASLVSSYANATTYTYTGQNFTDVHGVYTTTMRVTGTLVTSNPIPANSVDFDISGLLVSWSFNDGAQTISRENGVFNPNYPPQVTTDAVGNIIATNLFFFISPIATTLGQTASFIWVVSVDLSAMNAVCIGVQNGYCEEFGLPINRAGAYETGVWTDTFFPPIPTLSQWTLMLLAMMLGLVGIARVRKHV